MLALKSKLTMTLLMAAIVTMVIGTTFGQQTPAQRYQPVQDGAFRSAPPSVHVAPKQTQRLDPRFRSAPPNGVAARPAGASFTFSDAPGNLRSPARPGYEQTRAPGKTTGQIRQASFVADQQDEPNVPAILANQLKTNTTGNADPQTALPQTANTFRSPQTSPRFPLSNSGAPQVDEIPHKTPADFEAQMKQARNGLPRISPDELTNQQKDISAQMAEVRRRAEERIQQQAEIAAKAPIQNLENMEQTAGIRPQESLRQESQPLQTAQSSDDQQPASANQVQAPVSHVATSAEALPEADNTAAPADQDVSASDFIGKIAADRELNDPPVTPVQDPNTAPKLVAKHGVKVDPVPAVMQLTSASENVAREPLRDPQVRTASSETEDPASIKLSAPAIEVETFGPQSIGINKPANYQVVVRNNSATQAERILVGVNLPEWVDIENVNLTSGGKELTDGKNQARLVWSIDQIPGNASQTITITAVPRKAELFDVGVEWTLVPRTGKAAITVTEPKLEMNISGPMEVLYGETALYHVTVRNPGTGDAENVIVMLPEALGGERATLGNIEAGKEKNFQVELLARTAGELNLVATAAGEGNLTTSAERALTVRRAILGISLEGPGLKYAGSVAQYEVQITNTGDAAANEVVTAVALPPGVKYLGGIDAVKLIEGGMRWPVGSLDPGQTRKYTINCQLDTSGDLQLEVGARGKGDLAASSACLTTVETVADLVLTVADPKGPLPTGEEIPYEIRVQNRGSKSAKGVNLVMQFSEGIEPKNATGIEHRIVPGQVLFSPIEEIEPGQEVSFKVSALAMKSGTHIFRAQLTCQDSDSREIAEGTTRFFGESVQPTATAQAPPESNSFQPTAGNEFKR